MTGSTRYRIGFDIGGTFTDFILLDAERSEIRLHKCLTTPQDPSVGALEGLAELLQAAGVALADIGDVVHGTTLVTNALRNVNTEYQTIVSIRVRTRPNLSPIGPHKNASPQPIRNRANSNPPYWPMLALVAVIPERGSNSRNEGTRTRAYTKESIPSRAQPPHDAQKPRTWLRVKGRGTSGT